MEDRTPLDDGLYMPAEWSPHERCWMQWPSRAEVWGERLPEVYMAYARVARTIAEFEPVTMVVRPEDEAQARLACGKTIEMLSLPIDDSWARDSGPIFVVDGQGGVAGVHWQFNAWGDEYYPYDKDAAVGGKILQTLKMRCYRGPMVLEGGSITVDGLGTLITTEECLLNENRNPELTRQQIEGNLAFYLGVSRIIWLDRGLVDDETDGHVDGVASFAKPGLVLLSMPMDQDDPNHARMRDNAERLARAKDAHGKSLEVVELPLPSRLGKRADGRHVVGSYVNHYLANGAVIVPAYDDPMDERACKILGEIFPERQIVPVPALEIAQGGGEIHCITQQQPAGEALA